MIEFSWELVIYISIISFIAQFIKGIAGFGDPLISSPLLALRIDPKFITPANLLINATCNAYLTWHNRKAFSVKKVMPMLIAILAGIIPGTFLLANMSSLVLKAILGVLVVGLGIEMATRNQSKQFKGNKVIMLIVSFFSGISAGIFGINLFFVAYVERTTTDRSAFRGTIGFIFFIENMFRVVVYIVMDIFNVSVLLLFVACIPAGVLGFVIGQACDKKMPEHVVRKIVYIVFIAGGLSTFINAVFFAK